MPAAVVAPAVVTKKHGPHVGTGPAATGNAAIGIEWPIELLRVLAATMVVAAHYLPPFRSEFGLEGAFPLGFCYSGVNLFFVLTGYVFAPHLLGGTGHLLGYAARRFFRIYPLYLVSLLAYVALSMWAGRPALYLADHLALLQTTHSREIAGYYNIAFWSLPPEVEYYAALPLLALLLKSRLCRMWHLLLVAVALDLLVSAHLPKVSEPATAWLVLSVHLPGILSEFLIGTVAWQAARKAFDKSTYRIILATGLVAWTVLAAAFAASEVPSKGPLTAMGTAMVGHYGLLSAVAFGFIVSGVVGGLHGKHQEPHPLRSISLFAGGLTYGIYLLHNGALTAFAPIKNSTGPAGYLIVCLAATVLLAYLSSRWVEMPLRRLGKRLSRRLTGGKPRPSVPDPP